MMDWYEPEEDSYALIDTLSCEMLEDKIIIDMGCSTGVVTNFLKFKNIVLSIDLNIKALQNFNGDGNLIRSDLLEGIKQSEIDVCIFNPPYVPDFDCSILGGGKDGREVIDRFINEVEIGVVYLVIIEANKPNEVIALFNKRGYLTELIKIRKVIGETIIIIKAIRK